MNARPRKPKEPRSSRREDASDWEHVVRDLQGLRTFQRLQDELIEDLEQRVKALRRNVQD